MLAGVKGDPCLAAVIGGQQPPVLRIALGKIVRRSQRILVDYFFDGTGVGSRRRHPRTEPTQKAAPPRQPVKKGIAPVPGRLRFKRAGHGWTSVPLDFRGRPRTSFQRGRNAFAEDHSSWSKAVVRWKV